MKQDRVVAHCLRAKLEQRAESCKTLTLIQTKKLSLIGAAEALGISVSGVRRLLKKGVLPSLRVGGRNFLLETDVEAYLQGQYGVRAAVDSNPVNENGLDPLPKEVADFVREELK